MTGLIARPQGHRTVYDTRSWTLFGVVFAIHGLIALLVGESGWDDGYLTLAFARTFATTGHIALTPVSEVVEGATSPVWFLLMSVVHHLGITSFYGLHLASQLVAALCAGLAALFLYHVIRASVPTAASWISLLTLMFGPFRGETADGMEMTLLCVVVLAMMLLLTTLTKRPDGRSILGLALLSGLPPWIRLEATGYAVVGAVAMVVPARRYRLGAAIATCSVVSLGVLAAVRYLVFGTFLLPNTVSAKTWSPYSPPVGTEAWLHQMTNTALEILLTVLPAAAIAFVLLRKSGARAADRIGPMLTMARSGTLSASIAFGLGYVVAFVGVLVVVGGNYFNSPGRMGASATIVLIAVVSLVIPVVGETRSLTFLPRFAIVALFLLPGMGVSHDVMGIYYGRVAPADPLTRNDWTTAWRQTGESIDRVRQLLGQPTIKALVANVGAASLCCDRIQVLDHGLLANTELAHRGWDDFPAYVRRERPDVINTYGIWAQVSGIYDDGFLRMQYTPIVMDDAWLFLRNDDYDRLKHRCIDVEVSDRYFWPTWPGSAVRGGEDRATRDRDYISSLGRSEFCRLD